MTFDLGVWKSHSGLSATSASFIYGALCEGKSSPSLHPAAQAINEFYEELITTWPERPTFSPRSKFPKTPESPWAAPLFKSENHVLLSCRWEHAEIVLYYVTGLAARYGLTVFDPQSDEVYGPEFARHSSPETSDDAD